MKKNLVLCSMVLGSCLLLAQTTAPGASPNSQPTFPQDQTQAPGNAPGSGMPGSHSPQGAPEASQAAPTTTVEGCLSGSNGTYTVTDNSGNVTQLQVPPSAGSKLAPFEGKRVQVAGTPSSGGSSGTASSTAPDVGSSSGRKPSSLDAASIKMIAETCASSQSQQK